MPKNLGAAVAASKKRDVITLTDDDFKGKSFKTAPGGTYSFKISPKSKIVAGKGGNQIQLVLGITKGPHKDVNVFDRLMPHVGWKIAQLLLALQLGKKKALTLQELLKLIVGKELRAIIREAKWEGRKKNEIVQYLPLVAEASEEDEDDDEELDEDTDAEETGDDDEEDTEEEENDDEDSDDEDDSDDDDSEDDEEEESDEDDESDDAEEEDEDDDEDEEEEAPAPVKKGRGAKAAPPPATKAAAKKAAPAPAAKTSRRKK